MWILTKNKLPSIPKDSCCSKVVLVYNKFHDEIVTAVLTENNYWSYTGGASSLDRTYGIAVYENQITHWMELPLKPHNNGMHADLAGPSVEG